MSDDKPLPQTEHDWTIHSLNIHGVFFERWCQHTIAGVEGWTIASTNYPVEFPLPNGPLRGQQSVLDIRAEYRRDDTIVTLLIECKKNNPSFVNWIFFPKDSGASGSIYRIHEIENVPHGSPGWAVRSMIRSQLTTSLIASEARETRGSYKQFKGGDKTKTSNTAVSEAAYQVALATQAIFAEEVSFSDAHMHQALTLSPSITPPPYQRQVFLPLIVTTAHLFSCDYDPANISAATGELSYGDATLTEVPYLLFEYPLPRFLHAAPANLVEALTTKRLESFMRMDILVVHSSALSQVLRALVADDGPLTPTSQG
ncbi:MAG TPA: hypothetical protein VFL91_31230 [Thermomicrobiales bacterium]|nr:hypothetical protein [Thermomicrobiales bacterium]